MSELTPKTRVEKLLAGEELDPVTRIEKLLLGEELPPKTRMEMYYAAMGGQSVELPEPKTRLELFLAKAAGMSVETPDPVTRIEMFLSEWSGGGVELTVTGNAPVTLANAIAHAIVSLTQDGKVTQASTPTPSSPVYPVCNNGTVEYGQYGKNLANMDFTATTASNVTFSSAGQKLYASGKQNGAFADFCLTNYASAVSVATMKTASSGITRFEAGDTITVSFSNTDGILDLYVIGTDTSNSGSMSLTNNAVTFTPSYDVSDLWIRMSGTGETRNLETTVQIEYGGSATTYEPYKGGIHTSSDPVYALGKNLLGGVLGNKGYTSTGEISTSTTFAGTLYKIPCAEGDKFTASWDGFTDGVSGVFVNTWLTDGTWNTRQAISASTSLTYTIPSGVGQVNFTLYKTGGITIGDNAWIQVERGETATTYEPFGHRLQASSSAEVLYIDDGNSFPPNAEVGVMYPFSGAAGNRTISCLVNGGENLGAFEIHYYKADKTQINYYTISNYDATTRRMYKTVSLTATTAYVSVTRKDAYPTATIAEIKLESGATATPYVTPQTASVQNLFAVGTYADEQEVIHGTVTRKCGIAVLKGDEAVSTSNACYTIGISDRLQSKVTVVCSHFPYSSKSSSQTDDQTIISFSSTNIGFRYDALHETRTPIIAERSVTLTEGSTALSSSEIAAIQSLNDGDNVVVTIDGVAYPTTVSKITSSDTTMWSIDAGDPEGVVVSFFVDSDNEGSVSGTPGTYTIKLETVTTSAINATQFKSWLKEQYDLGTPVIVIYPLAEETTETVAGQHLTTAVGTNTVSVTSNVDPVKLTVVYKGTE